VVVAKIKVRTLKAEVEKGFVRTAVDHELVDPKAQINLVNGDDRALSGVQLRSSQCRKGIRVNIPEPDFGYFLRQRKRTRRRRPLPWEEFSFLFDGSDDPGIVSY
jgi:hypothetical protein